MMTLIYGMPYRMVLGLLQGGRDANARLKRELEGRGIKT